MSARSARSILAMVAVVVAAAGASPGVAAADPTDTLVPVTLDSPQCLDENDVLGYRECPHYGSWGDNLLAPYVFVELGANYRWFAGAAVPATEARSTTMTPTTAAATTSSHAVTFVERVGFGLTRHIYLAFDFEFGHFGAGSSPSTDMLIDGLASLGLRGRLGPIAIAAEVAGGVMTFPSDPSGSTEGMVEARGRAYVWLAPWCTVSAVAGTSLLRGDRMAGLYLGYHGYAFGGDR